MAGHFKKAGVGATRILREVRLESVEGYQVGQTIGVDLFQPGELVDVTGLRKGRGFQGGDQAPWLERRRGLARLDVPPGARLDRGSRRTPPASSRGHRLPGRMGAVRVTTPHLEVVRVLPEQHLLVVKGAVPGATGGLLLIRKSVKESKAQRAAKKKA
jgi:large subunit ribosomal protein L3